MCWCVLKAITIAEIIKEKDIWKEYIHENRFPVTMAK